MGRLIQNEFYNLNNNKLIKLPELSNFDVLILDNIDAKTLPWSFLDQFIQKNKGILFIGAIRGLRPDIDEILPFRITGNQLTGEFSVRINKQFSVLSPLDEYPPFNAINQSLGEKDNCITVATAGNLPLFGYSIYRQGAVFQVNGVDLGVWSFALRGQMNKDILPVFLEDVIKFLSPLGRSNRLLLKSSQDQCLVGSEINFQLKSYNKDFRLASGDFYLQFGNSKVPFFETKSGNYQASYVPREIGEFEVFAMGSLEGEELRSNNFKIKVIELIKEDEKEINISLLKEISEVTGGRYYHIDELENWTPISGEYYYETKRFSLDTPILYFIVFILIALDWFLRKREGVV